MQLDYFVAMTQRIIRQDGLDGLLPVLCLPKKKYIRVLEGVPDDKRTEIRSIALKWAQDQAAGEDEFLLAFREDGETFRVIRSVNGELEE